MQILFLMADGFEETEFVTPFDYLQRAGFEVALASVSGNSIVTGAHGLKIVADFALKGADTAKFDAVLLPGGGPGGGRNNPGRQQGKPKDARKTIARLFTYLHGQRVRLVFVLLCMLFTTLTSLVGGYLTAPIIDRLTLAVKPDAFGAFSARFCPDTVFRQRFFVKFRQLFDTKA